MILPRACLAKLKHTIETSHLIIQQSFVGEYSGTEGEALSEVHPTENARQRSHVAEALVLQRMYGASM